MIRIHYVPPSMPGAAPDLPAWSEPDTFTPVRPYADEALSFTRGQRSTLKLENVGLSGRTHRNTQDTLALSEAWQKLARAGLGTGNLKLLHDATTALGPDGRPNVQALKQARLVLRQWLSRQGPAAASADDAVRRLDGLLGRLHRRNLPMGDAEGQLPPLAERRAPTGKLDWLRPTGPKALAKAAARHLAAGRAELALGNLERACELAPGSARLHFERGRVLAEEGYYLDAEWAFLTADELRPDQPAIQAALGDLYAQMGHREMAVGAFERAIRLDPRHTDAHAQLGIQRYEGGQYESAAHDLQQAVSLDPENVVARYYLAQISLQENDLLRARYQLSMLRTMAPRLDLTRFGQLAPPALARETRRPEARHHWQLPRQPRP